MNILAVNGSPRRHWNTETILDHALAGAAQTPDAHVESVHLYPMKYSGCIGCYMCKQKGSPSSLCRFEDALTPVLEKAQEADVLLIGTPVYFFTESAGTRAFIERLLYPWSAFHADGYGTRRPKPMVAGLFYTLAGTEESVSEHGHRHFKDSTDQFFSLHFPHHELLLVYETLHTNTYGKFELNTFDPETRRKAREGRFAEDCEQAHALGASLALRAKARHAPHAGNRNRTKPSQERAPRKQ
jgi:multimeric flavodoxin WrbA